MFLHRWQRLRSRFEELDCVYLECAGKRNLMSRETFSAVARRIMPFCRTVRLGGAGEPLLNDSLPWMIGVTRSHRREAQLETGGILLDEGSICELIGAGLDSIAVSLDGAPAETHDEKRGRGAYRTTVRNMEILQKVKREMGLQKPVLTIDAPLARASMKETTDLLDLARRLGAAQVTLFTSRRVCPDGARGAVESDYGSWRRVASSYGIALQMPGEPGTRRGEGCVWDPRRYLAVSWEGEVRPCRYPLCDEDRYCRGGLAVADAPRFGNICERSFNAIWRSEAYRLFREQTVRGDPLPSVCKPCILIPRQQTGSAFQ